MKKHVPLLLAISVSLGAHACNSTDDRAPGSAGAMNAGGQAAGGKAAGGASNAGAPAGGVGATAGAAGQSSEAGDAGEASVSAAGEAGMGGAAGEGGSGGEPAGEGGASNGHTLVKALAGGQGFTCALTVAGEVRCWGNGTYGSLGDGTPVTDTKFNYSAVKVVGLTGAKKLIAAGWNACAISSDDHLLCWGFNGQRQFAPDPQTFKGTSTPISLLGFTGTAIASTIAFDGNGLTGHGCVVDAAFNIGCWGSNAADELGVTTPATSGPVLFPTGLSGYVSVAGGSQFTCGLTQGGGVKCWGASNYGALGDGHTLDYPPPSATPTQVVGLTTGVKQIASALSSTCALTTSGGVKCWGGAGFGELGTATPFDHQYGGLDTPTDVSGLTSGVTQITSGYRHFCALLTDKTIKCWGYNQNGELGDQPNPITINLHANLPVPVQDVSNIVAIGAGYSQTCAAPATGGVICWGSGWASGSKTSPDRIVPTYVEGI